MGAVWKIYFGAVLTVLCTITCVGRVQGLELSRIKSPIGVPFKNGTSYTFISLTDNSAITVHENGEVTTEQEQSMPEQRWTVVPHPSDSYALEFKQEMVPYNELSGFEDDPENPGIFPRPLGLVRRDLVGNIMTWNIIIRGRWCLQARGMGYSMDMDDCESFEAPWQLWKLIEVS